VINAQETDVDFDKDPDLSATRDKIVAGTPGAAYIRDWVLYALTPGTRVNQAYLYGRFKLGEDMEKCSSAFEENTLEKQRRAYHRLQDFLLAQHEYSAAWQITRKLRNAKESPKYTYRHFIFWRLIAASIAGEIALHGSSPWREIVTLPRPGLAVCGISLLLIILPPGLAELFQSPVHALSNFKGLFSRLWMVWFNAIFIVLLLGGFEWLLSTLGCPGCCEWKNTNNWQYHLAAASAAQALGYVINLVWRDRSLAGPA
jgi:hypothetical protein